MGQPRGIIEFEYRKNGDGRFHLEGAPIQDSEALEKFGIATIKYPSTVSSLSTVQRISNILARKLQKCGLGSGRFEEYLEFGNDECGEMCVIGCRIVRVVKAPEKRVVL